MRSRYWAVEAQLERAHFLGNQSRSRHLREAYRDICLALRQADEMAFGHQLDADFRNQLPQDQHAGRQIEAANSLHGGNPDVPGRLSLSERIGSPLMPLRTNI